MAENHFLCHPDEEQVELIYGINLVLLQTGEDVVSNGLSGRSKSIHGLLMIRYNHADLVSQLFP